MKNKTDRLVAVFGVFTRKDRYSRWSFYAEYPPYPGEKTPHLNAERAIDTLIYHNRNKPYFQARWVKMWAGEKNKVLRELNSEQSEDRDTLAWLNKAAAKGKDAKERAQLSAPYADQAHGTTVATDGARFHMVNRVVAVERDTPSFPNYKHLLSMFDADVSSGKVRKDELVRAIKAVAPFAREDNDRVQLCFDGCLSIKASSTLVGDGTAIIPQVDDDTNEPLYDHTGADVDTTLNYSYLLDALSGMGDWVEYRQANGKKPIMLRSETKGEVRTAIIAPMKQKSEMPKEEQWDDCF